MGRMRCNGISFDDIIKDLQRKGKKVPQITKKAVSKAGDILVQEIMASATASGLSTGGKTVTSVKKGPVGSVRGGAYVEAWSQGTRHDAKHPKGERNETIAFVNEYGRSGKGAMAGKQFMSKASQAAETKVAEIIEQELEAAANG